jgi:ABC-type Zn uptake system ZnuABC Zn-binding protein ZnuA
MRHFFTRFFLSYRSILLLLSCFALYIFFSFENLHQSETVTKPKIICTTAFIQNVVEEIAGDHWQIDQMIPTHINPHSYEFVKGDLAKCKNSSLIFYHGLGLEHSHQLIHFFKFHQNSYALGDYLYEKKREL